MASVCRAAAETRIDAGMAAMLVNVGPILIAMPPALVTSAPFLHNRANPLRLIRSCYG